MKTIVISEEWTPQKSLADSLTVPVMEYIHYHSAVKALDNLKEIDPNAVIIDTRDFPRHWKVLAQHLQSEHQNSQVILMTTSEQQEEVALHAHAIDPDIAILNAESDDSCEARLHAILFPTAEYQQAPLLNANTVVLHQVSFLAHYGQHMLTGDVLALSLDTLSLRLHHTPVPCPRQALLESCELSIHDTTLKPLCTVISAQNPLQISLKWKGITQKAQAIRLLDSI